MTPPRPRDPLAEAVVVAGLAVALDAIGDALTILENLGMDAGERQRVAGAARRRIEAALATLDETGTAGGDAGR